MYVWDHSQILLEAVGMSASPPKAEIVVATDRSGKDDGRHSNNVPLARHAVADGMATYLGV